MALFHGKSKRFTASQAAQILWDLPTDDDDSEAEADEEGLDELKRLESTSGGRASVDNNEVDQAVSSAVDEPTGDANDAFDESEGETDAIQNEIAEAWSDSGLDFQITNPRSVHKSKVSSSLKSSDSACKYFDSLFDEDMCQNIVLQTNLYKRQKQVATGRVSPSDKDITVEDLRAWIGLCVIMGIHQVPELQNYWSADPLLGVPSVSSVMTSKQFKKIVETIHCNDNTTNPPRDQNGHDKLHKVRPLLEKLGSKCAAVYKPSGSLSVDESMIPFKGRSTLKQYMPMKPVKRGYKVWCLADSSTGYVYAFDVYTGRSAEKSSETSTLGERVVIGLCSKTSLEPWSTIAFDNFFTTVKLMQTLYSRQLYSVGTVRVNRKDLPDMMKKKSKMQRGEFMFQTKGCISAVKWMDNKEVTVLSTGHDPKEVCSVFRRAKDGTRNSVMCPLPVAHYNKIMGGVDRFDQLRERYAIGRRSAKWWHRILYWLIDLAIVNAFIMYKISRRQESTVDQLTFRLQLARQLTSCYSNKPKRGRPVSFLANKRKVPDDVRLQQVGSHMPQQNAKYRRCRMCSTTLSEKRTRYTCTACDVPLCMEPCFRKFHGK